MSKILLIETSTADCSVALLDGEKIVALEAAVDPMSHTTHLTLLIQKALKKANWNISELDAVGLSKGPGSYTALRVGAATAKGICYGQEIPLIAIDTLQALSEAMVNSLGAQFQEEDRSFPMIDARRLEVYGALYDNDALGSQNPAAIILTKELLTNEIPDRGKLFLGGNGATKAKALIDNDRVILLDIGCSASHLATLALQSYEKELFADLAYFKPLYLKPPNITVPRPIWK